MFGKPQKLLYNASMFSPFFLFLYGCYFAVNRTLSLSATLFVLTNFILIILYYAVFYRSIKKYIPHEPIEIKSFKPNEGNIVNFALQVIPIIGSVFDIYAGLPINYVGLLIYIVMVGYLTLSNYNLISLLLFICKPKVYEIEIEGGGSGYLLATKKELKNSEEIKTAKNIFPYFYID